MSEPVIQIKNLSKVYNISHEQKASAGNATLIDVISGIAKKPLELVTGHKVDKEKFWALKDVNFEINQGDVVGIIGRNGSGKSTLLKVLSRIVEPTKGEIRMRGKVASLLEVGTGFHPELTGRENIFFNGAILGMSQKEIKSKFDEIVEFSEVEKFLDTPVKFYSSGMYVRLAFSVAAHLDPDILIVDEVLAVGDAAFQKKCLGKMKDVSSQGRTVLFVSHSISSIKALCNKGVWLDQGEVKEVGEINSVCEAYTRLGVPENIDLAKRPRMSHVSGEAKIVSIKIKDEDGKEESVLNSAKPFILEFQIDSQMDFTREANIHCGIMSAGQPLFTLSSEYTGTLFKPRKGINTYRCTVQPSMLAGGEYSINASFLHANSLGSHIDEIVDAINFSVEDLATPAKEEFINQKDAVYFVEHNWSTK